MNESNSLDRIKFIGIGTTVVIVVVLILLFIFTIKNKPASQLKETPSPVEQSQTTFKQILTDRPEGWKTYSTQYYGKTISLSHPEPIGVILGERPFNLNDEGTTATINFNCIDNKVCGKTGKSTMRIALYENRRNWSLSDWVEKSVYRPQNNCTTKDPRATLKADTFNNTVAFIFSYTADSKGSKGCLENPIKEVATGKDIIFMVNQTVFTISELYYENEETADLNKIAQTLKVQ